MTNDETTDRQETHLLLSSSFVLVWCSLNSSIHVRMSVVVWSLTTVVANHSLGCLYPLRESFTGCIGGFLFELLIYIKV